jgi:DNA repair protein RadC
LREAAELLGITLLDHVILGEERHYSFADEGWP